MAEADAATRRAAPPGLAVRRDEARGRVPGRACLSRSCTACPPWSFGYFSIYGPRQRPDMAYQRHTRPCWTAGRSRSSATVTRSRSSTFVEDCRRWHRSAALEGGQDGEVYNLGGGVGSQLLEAIGFLAEALGVTPELRVEPGPAGDQRHTQADFGKAARRFGYAPTVEPREGLARQARWQADRHLR